jgi:hypothetical protein
VQSTFTLNNYSSSDPVSFQYVYTLLKKIRPLGTTALTHRKNC